MFALLEIDRRPVVAPEGWIVISFLQLLNDWEGKPSTISRFSLPVELKQVYQAQTDPQSLQIYVECDHQLFSSSGYNRIVDVGFCTASYRSSNNETLYIYSITDLIWWDSQMRTAFDSM